MKILLAVDDSRFVARLIDTGLRQIRQQGVQVQVLHVVNWSNFMPNPFPAGEIDPMLSGDQIQSLLTSERMRADTLLNQAADRLRSLGFEVATAVREGDPKREILDCAKEWGADLILVGSHGHNGVSRFLLGSVSDAVARHADCSVEIVRIRDEAHGIKSSQ
jgi:nucleotide-binding universal stress UspA family protein